MDKRITIVVGDDGKVIVDLGGALDYGCCGCPATQLDDELKALGLDMECVDVHCRLPVGERIVAKLGGICNMSPLLQSDRLANARETGYEV